ncbi:hypothetical protein SLI_3618 [Streptomyces lividans 1326]|uniref:Uncharacterized protein n=1 Tax=Streptomyces lividans 1326 TaxID=1200984 RepID=A0A7U9DQK2_STRLI|nr:hypothetical protein SLI_3618 [Streptomyces lividans 1326]
MEDASDWSARGRGGGVRPGVCRRPPGRRPRAGGVRPADRAGALPDGAGRAGRDDPTPGLPDGGGDTVPTLPLLRRLAKALDGTLNLTIDEGDSRVTFTPHAA